MRKQAVHLLPCPCKVPLQIAKQFIAKIENAAIFIRRFEGAPIGNSIRAFRLRSEQTTFADKFRPCGIILSNLQIDKPLFHSGKRTKIFRISFIQESDRLQGKRRIAVLQGFQEKSPTTANHLFRRRRKRENRLFDIRRKKRPRQEENPNRCLSHVQKIGLYDKKRPKNLATRHELLHYSQKPFYDKKSAFLAAQVTPSKKGGRTVAG